ncbi:MAG: hypothetical protein IKM36_01065, partial [Oscillospiraceae bacterium]|nr:hypothetical protein [Oscillospiraceae bacterium]
VPTVEQAAQNATLVIAGVNTRTAPTTAAYVFVVGGQVKDTSAASVSVFMKNSTTDGAATDANNNTYFTTKAVVDGEIKSVKMLQSVYNTIAAKPAMSAYTNMTMDANGYISGLTVSNPTDFAKYAKDYVGFNGEDGLYNNGIVTMKKADTTTESFSVNASVPVYVFDTTTSTVTQTTVDAFSTTLAYNQAIVVLDSAEKLLNNNDIVTAIYVSLVANVNA